MKVAINSKMKTTENSSSHCIFCTSQCPSSFTIFNGKPVKLKTENGTGSKPFLSCNFVSGAQDDSNIENHLKVIFILRKILDIEASNFSKFLGKCEGQFHPGLWISLCLSCDKLVAEFWEKLKEIGRLERRLKCIKSELTGFVQDTEAFKRSATGVDLVWNEIRKNAVAETGNANDFEEKFHIERLMVTTLENEDKFADEYEDDRFPECDREEPLIKIELQDKQRYENAEEGDDPTYYPDSNLQGERPNKKGRAAKYSCLKCSKLFKSEERLKAHYKYFHTEINCNSCDKKFTSLKLLKDHEKRVHTPKGSFPCPSCSKVFTTLYKLKAHRQLNHDDAQQGFPCSICSKVFASRLKLWCHKRSTHEKKTYLCSHCGISFKSQSSHSYHVKMVHKRKNKSATCSKCGKPFASSRAVSRHMREVHGFEPNRFSCSECNVVVKSKQQLDHHIKAIHNPEKLICPTCRKSFTTAKYLNQHVIRHHSTPAQKESWTKCPNCEMRFYQKYLLKHHLVRSSCRPGKLRNLGCSVCSKLFDSEDRLKTHYRNYHTTLPCKSCDKSFRNLKLLTGHEKRVHTPKRSFPCPTCFKEFVSSFTLWRHKRSAHEENKTYHCSTCGRNFKSASSLSYHVHTVHKPAFFPCPHCETVFNHNESLKEHVKLKHSDERKPKPATCSKCGKLCSSSKAVSRHIREVHEPAPKRVSCSECNVVVKSKHHLDQHIKAIHNPEKLICPTCRKSFTTEKYLNLHVTRNHSTQAQKESWTKCPNCEMRFFQSYLLKKHLLHSSCRLGKREETQAIAEQE